MTKLDMMNAIPVVPESAPFTPAQRAWLNGFLAGALNLRTDGSSVAPHGQNGSNGSRLHAQASSGSVNGNGGGLAVAEAPAADEEEDFPWHDPALPLDERVSLAEGKPFARRLMAAMAQLDCGACGYDCRIYSEAIASGSDKSLTKCAPGGKETARKLKELVAAEAASPGPVTGAAAAETSAKAPAAIPERGRPPERSAAYDRHHPFPARLLRCDPLNRPGSTKDTRFVALDLKGSGLTYDVGDALGVFPENDPERVARIIKALGASGAEDVMGPDGEHVSLFDALGRHYSLGRPTDLMFELLINSAADAGEAGRLKEILADDGDSGGDEVLDLLEHFPSARPDPAEFVTALNPLQPRLYSISSSLKAYPDQVHLTVGVVRYLNGRRRECTGVCSTHFSDRVRPGQQVRAFVHPSHGFKVPADGNTPMIMVGPGTGIAPFRAFLQERRAAGAAGRNWLLFGDQRREHDFLYEEELEAYRRDGLLTRLDTAFSRDQADKVYVQHRMLENAAELWRWLQEGAHFYVCGDAKRMATDVDAALRRVVAEQGGMSPEGAKAYVGELTKAKRYQRDVY